MPERTLSFDVLRAAVERHSKEENAGVSLMPPILSKMDIAAILRDSDEPDLLSGKNLSGIDLTCANLTGLNLKDTIFLDRTSILTGSNLNGAMLQGARLTGAVLQGAHLVSAQFDAKSSLIRADLTGSDLTGANLTGVDATGVDLSGAQLINTRVDDAVLDNATVAGALWHTRGNISGDAASSLLGLSELRVSFCASDHSETNSAACTKLVDRPDVGALTVLRAALSDAGDTLGARQVLHVMQKAKTDLAWAQVDKGETSALPNALYRTIWHQALLDHGLAPGRVAIVLIGLMVLFAGGYAAMVLLMRAGGSQLFWVRPAGGIVSTMYGGAERQKERREKLDWGGREAIRAGVLYSFLASVRVGTEKLSVLKIVEKTFSLPWLVEGTGWFKWVAAGQSLVVLSIVGSIVWYLRA